MKDVETSKQERLVRTASVLFVFALMLCVAGPVRAASCSSAEYHQFDFFVGNWIVRDRSGHIIGTDLVSKDYGGCVLIEKWRDVGDSGEGLGLIGYQPARKTWHRDFVVHGGVVLAIDGKMDGAIMVMTGKDYPKPDVTRIHRVTWTPNSDGSVGELWSTSTDDGRSWQVQFDGIFRRLAE